MPPGSFRYFRDPSRLAGWTEEPGPCDVCGEDRPGFAGVRGAIEDEDGNEREVELACEDCIRSGRLADRGGWTNEHGTDLTAWFLEHEPGLGDDEIGRRVREREDELTQRTPLLITWQEGLVWPAHCGDLCCFAGELGQPDIRALAPDGDGEAWFLAHLHASARPWGEGKWEFIRRSSPEQRPDEDHDLTVYSFRCLTCGEIVLSYDAN